MYHNMRLYSTHPRGAASVLHDSSHPGDGLGGHSGHRRLGGQHDHLSGRLGNASSSSRLVYKHGFHRHAHTQSPDLLSHDLLPPSQSVMNHLWLGMSLQEAIAAPVVFVDSRNTLKFERGFDKVG